MIIVKNEEKKNFLCSNFFKGKSILYKINIICNNFVQGLKA